MGTHPFLGEEQVIGQRKLLQEKVDKRKVNLAVRLFMRLEWSFDSNREGGRGNWVAAKGVVETMAACFRKLWSKSQWSMARFLQEYRRVPPFTASTIALTHFSTRM